jgi:hypothetical protein
MPKKNGGTKKAVKKQCHVLMGIYGTGNLAIVLKKHPGVNKVILVRI